MSSRAGTGLSFSATTLNAECTQAELDNKMPITPATVAIEGSSGSVMLSLGRQLSGEPQTYSFYGYRGNSGTYRNQV